MSQQQQQQQEMMSSYEQPSTPLLPEKLPGIDKLPMINKSEDSPASSPPVPTSMIDNSGYLPPPSLMNGHQQPQYYNNSGLIYHQHMSPPLTPAVSPSSVLLDSMQFKRKFSVDVGPFGFGSNIPHPSTTSMHDGNDAYRRSSCSAVSFDQQQQQQQDYQQFLNAHHGYADHNLLQQQQHHHQQQQQGNPVNTAATTTTTTTGNKRRNSRSQLSGPNTQHKHACNFPYCSWSFKRYEHLKRHMLVHTGKRPHVCHFPGCGKSFSRSDNFHAHYRTHTKKTNLMNGTGTPKRKGSNANTTTTSSSTSTSNSAASSAAAAAAAVAVAASAAAAVAASNTSFVEDNRTPAYFPKQQSFDMTHYQDMYGHRHSYSEGSDDFHGNAHYLRTSFHQPQYALQHPTIHSPESVATTSTSTTASNANVSSLLNHELNNPGSFYGGGEESRFNYQGTNTMVHYRDNYGYYPNTTTTSSANDNSSIAAAVAVVAAAASSSSNSRRSSSTSSTATTSTTTLQQQQQHKSHICPVSQCQRRFKRLEHLKRHMRIHTLERPFGCSFPNCHKTFSRSDNLSQHMKTHQRVEDRRRRQQRNDEPMKQQHLPPLQQQQQQQPNEQDTNNTNMMVGMSWHHTGTVGC